MLAKWLATEPKVLILDSPTVGVDVGARAGIFPIVHELAEDGMAILLISDEIPEVYFNADRVLHMRGGRIVETFVPAQAESRSIEEAKSMPSFVRLIPRSTEALAGRGHRRSCACSWRSPPIRSSRSSTCSTCSTSTRST